MIFRESHRNLNEKNSRPPCITTSAVQEHQNKELEEKSVFRPLFLRQQRTSTKCQGVPESRTTRRCVPKTPKNLFKNSTWLKNFEPTFARC